MEHLPDETQRRITKITIDALLGFAENHALANSSRERANTDYAAHEFLSYAGFDVKTMNSFWQDYEMLKGAEYDGNGRCGMGRGVCCGDGGGGCKCKKNSKS